MQLKLSRGTTKLTLFDLSDLICHIETPFIVSLTTSFIVSFFRVYKPTSYNSLKRTPLFISSSSRIKTRIPVTGVDPAASTRLPIESKLPKQVYSYIGSYVIILLLNYTFNYFMNFHQVYLLQGCCQSISLVYLISEKPCIMYFFL